MWRTPNALLTAVFAAAALGVTSCSAPQSRAHVLTFSDAEDVDNLNPLLSTETIVNDLSAFTMGYLFVFDDKGTAIPSLCVRVPTQANGLISSDGKSITFELRRGVVWQDGAPFTSADVAFTVKTILDPNVNVLTREGWDDIARVDTPNAYTAIFRLHKPYAAFLNRFFTPVGNPAILPKHLLAGHNVNRDPYNALPVGIGPFKYVRWNRGNDVEMVAFDRYWGGRPKLDEIIYKVVPDVNTVLTQVASGELDMFLRVPAAQLEVARAIPGTRTVAYDTTGYGHIDFNMARPIFADPRVRIALTKAIDVRDLQEKVDHGSGFLACTPISHLSWAYDAHAPCYPFDLAAAAKTLEDAGWRLGPDGVRAKNGIPLDLQFVGNTGNPGLDARVLLIQRWFKQIGVALEYRTYPTNELFASYSAGGIVATGKYDLTSYAWSLPPDPDIRNLIACTRFPPAGQNYMHYCDRTVDAALNDALLTYDRTRRRADYLLVQERLARDVPFVVLSQRTEYITARDSVMGLRPGPSMDFWNPTQIDVR